MDFGATRIATQGRRQETSFPSTFAFSPFIPDCRLPFSFSFSFFPSAQSWPERPQSEPCNDPPGNPGTVKPCCCFRLMRCSVSRRPSNGRHRLSGAAYVGATGAPSRLRLARAGSAEPAKRKPRLTPQSEAVERPYSATWYRIPYRNYRAETRKLDPDQDPSRVALSRSATASVPCDSQGLGQPLQDSSISDADVVSVKRK